MDNQKNQKEKTAQGLTASSDFSLSFYNRDSMFNVDDIGRAYEGDKRMSGCFSLNFQTRLRQDVPGSLFVNGEPAGSPIIGVPDVMGNQTVGLFLRQYLLDYDKDYLIRVEGLQTESGEFLEPFELTIHTRPKTEPGTVYPNHDRIVLNAAREGAVLLKNENALPLTAGSVLNAVGRGVHAYHISCVGAGKINARYGIRFVEGVRKYSSLILNEELSEFYRCEKELIPPEEMLANAAKSSDTVVYILTRPTGEGQDSLLAPGGYYLTQEEKDLMAALRKSFQKLIVILNTGFPIEMNWIDMADAILWTGLNGMAGGRALAEILEGTVCPSGRLPDTWTYDYYDIPSSINYPIKPKDMQMKFTRDRFAKRPFNVTVYEEGLYVGYRYFETFKKPVAFPFGHGLSYTSFKHEILNFTNNGADVDLHVRVTNTGKCLGKESVLIFAKLPEDKLEQPSRRLVDFAKTDYLAPGASEILQFRINAKRFDSYDTQAAQWIIEAGEFVLYLGGSVSEATEIARFNLPENIIVQQVKNRVYPPIPIKELSKNDPAGTWPQGKQSGIVEANDLPHRRWRESMPEQRPVTGSKPEKLITLPMVMENPELLNAFVLQMSDYELCRCSAGGQTADYFFETGIVGRLYAEGELTKYQLPENYYYTDGNNGLNINAPNIGFPVSTVVCATFNEKLAYEEGCAIAEEALDLHLMCLLAPAANLHRNPLCGRHSEYFSEDPLLAGRMAGQEGRGFQARGICSTIKHFFANNAEFLRGTNHAIMTERTARELYLKVFETICDVYDPDSVMTGYNAANGVWCGEDEELLIGILRDEWGFNGYVMTDWGGSGSCAGGAPAQAGLAWVAPGSMDDSEITPILEALQNGTLDRQRLLANVRDIFRIIIKYPHKDLFIK